MKFEFGKFTEITDLAFEVNPNYKQEGYIRFFICPHVNDFWFARVLKDTNEDYEKQEGVFLLERNNIWKQKSETLNINKVKRFIEEDDGSNWDIKEYRSIEMLIEDIDGGFGILNLKEEVSLKNNIYDNI